VGRLESKVALVFGAGSIGPGIGNGKATAIAYAREKAKVVCVDINLDAAEETAQLIRSEGGDATALKADVKISSDVAEAVGKCITLHGRVDILNNNVGIAEPGNVIETTEESWDRVIDTNLKGCFLTMKHTIPHFIKQGGGAIVNVSSIVSLVHTGVPYAGYSASKAALNQLTKVTAIDFASKNIRVNAILPGLMKTPMVASAAFFADAYAGGDIEKMWSARAAQCPIGRMGEPWDVANAAVFLASDEASYITGATLVVDGGITLRIN
jgi:NAD(P)-dependent dehydrogenase (short-subunit alcohol dehydrogenase family)